MCIRTHVGYYIVSVYLCVLRYVCISETTSLQKQQTNVKKSKQKSSSSFKPCVSNGYIYCDPHWSTTWVRSPPLTLGITRSKPTTYRSLYLPPLFSHWSEVPGPRLFVPMKLYPLSAFFGSFSHIHLLTEFYNWWNDVNVYFLFEVSKRFLVGGICWHSAIATGNRTLQWLFTPSCPERSTKVTPDKLVM